MNNTDNNKVKVAVKSLEENGFALIQDFLPSKILTQLRKAMERVCDEIINELYEDKKISEKWENVPFEARFAKIPYEISKNFGRSWRERLITKEIFDAYSYSPLVKLAASYFNGGVNGHSAFNGRPNLPKQRLTTVPWHQDLSYFGKSATNSQFLVCWIPLVHVDSQNGCMDIIPGTHCSSYIQHSQEKTGGKFHALPDTDTTDKSYFRAIMNPGDLLCFNAKTFHRSVNNVSEGIRWSIDLRYFKEGDCSGDKKPFSWTIKSDKKSITSFEEWLKWGK